MTGKHAMLMTVADRFDVTQQDIFKINEIVTQHIQDASDGFYANSEDEKNHIRKTLCDIVRVAYSGV